MATNTPGLSLVKPETSDTVAATITALAENFAKLDFVVGAAAATDGAGNPTPDPATFPPANFREGTVFKAVSYPAGVDGGAMEFRREGGAGAEAWVWRWGSFRASNSNGGYVRSADGRQECEHLLTATLDITTASAGGFRSSGGVVLWTYPAAFAAAPRNGGVSANVNALLEVPEGTTGGSATTASPIWWRAASATAVAVAAELKAVGKWKA